MTTLAGVAIAACAVMVTPRGQGGWGSLAPLLSVILVAMCCISAVVFMGLQRPLRRLDRAVARLGRGDTDEPVPAGSVDEVGRLGANFEAMRAQFVASERATRARAAVARELSFSQPLGRALGHVCSEIRRSSDCSAVLIVVAGSEMSDAFAVVDGVPGSELEALLHEDGPIGIGFRSGGTSPLLLAAGPSTTEARLSLGQFCVAPLRVGSRVHGVIALARQTGSFCGTDVELLSGAAEHVALALERYTFLATVQRQASTDDLTGLHNHRFLVDYLGQQVALAERLNAPLALLMIDIDHFKALNDAHGHPAGDTALAAFAQTLVASVRRSDLAARYGGEEFSVVMANTTARDAHLVAEKIRSAVAAAAIELPDRTLLSITVSVGGAAYPEDTGTAAELLSLADEALYRAKRSGRNRTCMSGDAEDAPRPALHEIDTVAETA